MIQLPRKLFYALEAVLYIAYNSAQGPISSKEIAEVQGLPPRYLEQLMQRLVRVGILRGVRGPRGGYVLARERRRISVADICEVAQEKEGEEEKLEATLLGKVSVEPFWQDLHGQMREAMASVTLLELCESALAKKVARRSKGKADYTI